MNAVNGASGKTDPVISVDHLRVAYGQTVAVDSLSFSANLGEVLAILGPNGAGKTTTVEALEGYRKPTSGTVSVLGLDPVRQHGLLAPHIGVMLQQSGIYPTMNARDALALFACFYAAPEDPASLADLLGLGGVLKTAFRRLSGGEQRRLSLALALIGKPEVVFLDEPTSGVDLEGRLVIREVIKGLRSRGCCVLLATHELDEADRVADRVLVISKGRLVAEGTPADLKTEYSVDSLEDVFLAATRSAP